MGVPSSELETARLILGGSSSLLSEELLDERLDATFDELPEDELLVSPRLGARRNRGRSGSSSDELEDGRDDAELLLSSELDEEDRLNTGRSGSLSRDEELLVISSEFDALRSTGRFPLLLPDESEPELRAEAELLDELLFEELAELAELLGAPSGRGNGFVGSSAAKDAVECSSGVPSRTNVIVSAL